MTKWIDPITAARADLELEVARLRKRIEELEEQLRQAQQRRTFARSGE